MAHLPLPVADTAAYATETRLAVRVERVIEALDAELVRRTAPPVPGPG
jgi:hypothetical protein